MLTVDSGDVITNTANSGTINWAFNSGSEYFNYLANGESLVLTYTVLATDSSGGTANQTVVVTINGTNDAPILSDTVLAVTQTEDDGVPSGAVGTLVSSLASGSNISDLDASNPKGIAITATDSNRGTWYYSTNGGTNWTIFTAADASARLLLADANTRIYFQPTANWHGSVISGLTIRA